MRRLMTLSSSVLLGLGLLACDGRREATSRGGAPTKEAVICPRVSLLRVLVDRTSFDGRRIETTGFLAIEFESTALYLNEEAFEKYQIENSVRVIVDEREARRKLGGDRGWVEVSGVFDAMERDPTGCSSRLTVDAIGRWPPAGLSHQNANPRGR